MLSLFYMEIICVTAGFAIQRGGKTPLIIYQFPLNISQDPYFSYNELSKY